MRKLCLCWLSSDRDEPFTKSPFVIRLHVFLQHYRARTSPCAARVSIANKIYPLSMPSFIIHWAGSLLSRGKSWIAVDAADTNKKLGKTTVEYCHNIIMLLKQKNPYHFQTSLKKRGTIHRKLFVFKEVANQLQQVLTEPTEIIITGREESDRDEAALHFLIRCHKIFGGTFLPSWVHTELVALAGDSVLRVMQCRVITGYNLFKKCFSEDR